MSHFYRDRQVTSLSIDEDGLNQINANSKIARFIMRVSPTFANHLLTKMLTLAGTGRYRAEYRRPETPTKQASVVLNGIGRDTTERPMLDSTSSGSDTVGDYGPE